MQRVIYLLVMFSLRWFSEGVFLRFYRNQRTVSWGKKDELSLSSLSLSELVYWWLMTCKQVMGTCWITRCSVLTWNACTKSGWLKENVHISNAASLLDIFWRVSLNWKKKSIFSYFKPRNQRIHLNLADLENGKNKRNHLTDFDCIVN